MDKAFRKFIQEGLRNNQPQSSSDKNKEKNSDKKTERSEGFKLPGFDNPYMEKLMREKGIDLERIKEIEAKFQKGGEFEHLDLKNIIPGKNLADITNDLHKLTEKSPRCQYQLDKKIFHEKAALNPDFAEKNKIWYEKFDKIDKAIAENACKDSFEDIKAKFAQFQKTFKPSESIEEILAQEKAYKNSGFSDDSDDNLDEMFAEEFKNLHNLVDPLDMGKSLLKVSFDGMAHMFRNDYQGTSHPEKECIRSYIKSKLPELFREMDEKSQKMKNNI